VADCFELGNKPLGSVKGGEILDKLSVLSASYEELCSLQLISYENMGYDS
jgi:hypothetical protein